ncbi:MAG: putative metalloprotease with PDZ domain [Lentimonas sp.]|jgi:predicted metalloprotease with PDZ domain
MNIRYILSQEQSHQQYLQIEVEFTVTSAVTEVHLPTWRPGRYEIGKFAKNIKGFKVFDPKGKVLHFKKTNTSTWAIETEGIQKIKVCYSYYAADLNGGSTFLNQDQMYVNGVNCLVYTDETVNDPCEMELKIPENYIVACNLKDENRVLKAKNFDQLVDSPFIASATIQHDSYTVNGVDFNIWIQGLEQIDWKKLKKDFTAFTKAQSDKFGEFPVDEYHFLFQITPYKAYHGVEHCASTVILLGPTHDIFKGFYSELLGVSSHELYHTWNVKAIRPIEMFPYDFKKENFSSLGYLCEGVTTYMGDLFLYKSKVFTFDQYALEMNKQLQKHFDNPGRFNLSVAESSHDTWLDGYEKGAPGRKVSIYTEGCLLAFVKDVRILKATENKYGLDEVIRRLYFDLAAEGEGVSEEQYKAEIENITGEDWTPFFKDYLHGTKGFEGILTDSFEELGLELVHTASALYSEAQIGIKTQQVGNHFVITDMYTGSPADMSCLMLGDEIIGINGNACQGELEGWLNQYNHEEKHINLIRKGKIMEITLPELQRTFFNTYSIKKLDKLTIPQERAFAAWSK